MNEVKHTNPLAESLQEAKEAWARDQQIRDAAPKMLEALKLVAGSDNWRCFEDSEWDVVNAAIAEAEGRS